MWFLIWLGHLYADLWSNMWAPSIWTLLGVGLSHLGLRRLHKKHHDEQMKVINDRSGK